jgi:hypothetical protein
MLPLDAVILSMHPEATYYFAGNKGISREAALTIPPSEFIPAMRETGVSHMLINTGSRFDRIPFATLLEEVCTSLIAKGSFPGDIYLFEIAEPGVEVGDSACTAMEEYREKLRLNPVDTSRLVSEDG